MFVCLYVCLVPAGLFCHSCFNLYFISSSIPQTYLTAVGQTNGCRLSSLNTWRWPSNFYWNCNFSLSSLRFAFFTSSIFHFATSFIFVSLLIVYFASLSSYWSVLLACEKDIFGIEAKKFCFLFASFPFKGSLTRDFRHHIFFINQCPPGPWVLGPFRFFRKFAEIFANECLSAVSMTPAKKEKNFEINFFSFFVESSV